MSEFGDLLRSLRLAADLTQVELAAKVRISQEFLSHLERGRNPPKPSQLLKLAAILDLKGKALHQFVCEGYLAHVPKEGRAVIRSAMH